MGFEKLTADNLRKVRLLLKKQYPKSAQMLNIVDLQLKGKFLKDSFQTTLYGIPDTDIVNATWTPSKLLEKTNPSTNIIYVPPAPSLRLDSIRKSYQRLVDWTKPQIFESVPQHFVPHLEKIATDRGGYFSEKYYLSSRYLPKDNVKKLNLASYEKRSGNKFEIASLSDENTIKMCEHWKFGNEDTARALQEMIRIYGCAKGIFKKGRRGNTALVSWAQLLNFGTVGSLYTLEQFRGKGLGEWAFADCLRLMAEVHGLTPACEVETNNAASNKMMDRIGLQIYADIVFLRYVPPII